MTKPTKIQITEAVLKQLPYENEPVEKLIRTWWSTMSGRGLRLTPLGDKKFQEAGIEFYNCPIKVKHATWYSFLNECNTKLKCPYFFSVNKKEGLEPFVRLYDSKIAMMMTLYGDIESYLESIKVQR
jgi:hypothetical protein